MLSEEAFLDFLEDLRVTLIDEARETPFLASSDFESRVRELAIELLASEAVEIDPAPPLQAFPDIAIDNYGLEVKHTLSDSWRCVGNSVRESNRIEGVDHIFVVYGKMGGVPDVRIGAYENCVVHVRTSHVPRFELQMDAERSLFEEIGVEYREFCSQDIHGKMRHIREYARGRLGVGERLWWLEDEQDGQHSVPIQARLYTSLSEPEKRRYRAEATLLCPQVVGRARTKYNDVVLFLSTYRGVLCHQARDLFSAGSVGNPQNQVVEKPYIRHAIRSIEDEIRWAASELDDALFLEYWGVEIPVEQRLQHWLERADSFAEGWTPSRELFLEE